MLAASAIDLVAEAGGAQSRLTPLRPSHCAVCEVQLMLASEPVLTSVE